MGPISHLSQEGQSGQGATVDNERLRSESCGRETWQRHRGASLSSASHQVRFFHLM